MWGKGAGSVHWLLMMLCFVAGQPSPPQTLDSKSIFVNDNLEWRAQPGALKNYSYRSTSGSLLIFRAGGEFDRLDCTLVREEQHGPVSINYRRSYSLSVGTWSKVGNDEIRVASRVIYVTIPKLGAAIPGPNIESRWTVHGQVSGRLAAAIEGGGSRYVPLQNITSNEIKALDQVIRLHLKEASARGGREGQGATSEQGY
jgi:hypothetical protein